MAYDVSLCDPESSGDAAPVPDLLRTFLQRTPCLAPVCADIQAVAEFGGLTCVLICGESGVGKEMVAKLVHDLSPRAGNPFVAVNCGGLSEGTLQSELFGHVKGAYTGATSDKAGFFAVANGGTLFLDEVGEMPISAQPVLLRVLQGGKFYRVGCSSREQVTDVRIIAATNRDPAEAIRSGALREDLFYRLQGFEIFVPPLRERQGDILPLAQYFSESIARECQARPLPLSSQAQDLLLSYRWPGNVRELFNALRGASIRALYARAGAMDVPHFQGSSLSAWKASCFPSDPRKAMANVEPMSVTTGLGVSEAVRQMVALFPPDAERPKSLTLFDGIQDAAFLRLLQNWLSEEKNRGFSDLDGETGCFEQIRLALDPKGDLRALKRWVGGRLGIQNTEQITRRDLQGAFLLRRGDKDPYEHIVEALGKNCQTFPEIRAAVQTAREEVIQQMADSNRFSTSFALAKYLGIDPKAASTLLEKAGRSGVFPPPAPAKAPEPVPARA